MLGAGAALGMAFIVSQIRAVYITFQLSRELRGVTLLSN